jgi:N-acetyl-alpha-D-muramate 1-phosphate uridylyltransferase
MILAAGRGERMRPLTDHTPKPLLKVGGSMLIERTINSLVQAGFTDLVINHAWHGNLIESALGNGARYGAHISYSPEPPGALETGGGIHHALPLLGDKPFLVVNSDIWTDFPFAKLCRAPDTLSHLVLVDNPPHKTQGDFALSNGKITNGNDRERLTFSGIGAYRPELFTAQQPGRFPLAPLLRQAADTGQISGEHYRGRWMDIGTPQRLEELRLLLDAEDLT